MKFGKRLQRLMEDSLPEWRDKFIAYKRLKKSLKLIFPDEYSCPGFDTGINSVSVNSKQHDVDVQDNIFNIQISARRKFIALLIAEIDKMNTFFLEKEEEFVIRLQEVKGKLEKHILQLHQVAAAGKADKDDINVRTNLHMQQQQQQQMMMMRMMSDREMVELRKAIVNIHGEMVLLENYSALNYTGLVKIIKKHDKRTGGLLRMPFIQSVLQEPFFATDIIAKLVHECEETLQRLLPLSINQYNNSDQSNNVDRMNATAELQRSTMMSTNAAANSTTMSSMIMNATGGEHLYELENSIGVGVDDDVDRICRNIVAAWRTMKEFRKGSSTYNFFSIPPFGYDMEQDAGQLMGHLDQQMADHSTVAAAAPGTSPGCNCKPVAALVC